MISEQKKWSKNDEPIFYYGKSFSIEFVKFLSNLNVES